MSQSTESSVEIRKSWAGVQSLRWKLKRIGFGSQLGGALYPHFLEDAAHSLPFLHAYSILGDALQLRADAGDFPYRLSTKGFPRLGPLFDAAKDLDWCGHQQFIGEGIARRNELAHRGECLPRFDCWRHIDAIGDVLRETGCRHPL